MSRLTRFIKKLIDRIPIGFEFGGRTCPDCGGKLHDEFLDMTINELVYVCEKCGKKWV